MSSKRPVELGRDARLFLLFISEVNLVMGVLFFVYPSLVIGLWPWTVKALAVRFIGAIFLAIAFGCWSALRAKIWQRAKILVLVGGTFFGITSIVAVVLAVSQGGGYVISTWTGYFLVAGLGNFYLLNRYGWPRKPQDRLGPGQPWKTARWFFRIQTVVVGVFGIMMLLLPDVAQHQFWPWLVKTPTLQMFAGLFLATCLATGWASLQTDIGRIRVLLPLDVIFPSLALLAVGIHWDVISIESPGTPVTGVWVFIYAFVAVGSACLYFFSRKPATT
ncbi:hypothetical protein AUF78_09950 [archaeon 13_1_20CM_2_51_12]|nr:MAG: hypothetical protein AUI97_09680 [Crenarchaeota archaeon 13_1_40CM_3_52_17]OLE69683.1 MAG: hypothetical protein AUF78_09950 [archaeon 13_1_20CM_2_51_12]